LATVKFSILFVTVSAVRDGDDSDVGNDDDVDDDLAESLARLSIDIMSLAFSVIVGDVGGEFLRGFLLFVISIFVPSWKESIVVERLGDCCFGDPFIELKLSKDRDVAIGDVFGDVDSFVNF
jgi:hypothetical protein